MSVADICIDSLRSMQKTSDPFPCYACWENITMIRVHRGARGTERQGFALGLILTVGLLAGCSNSGGDTSSGGGGGQTGLPPDPGPAGLRWQLIPIVMGFG